MPENQDKNLLARPPIVVVMGHVDHGKTTLLDFIRKTNLVSREAGGITQSIGAYEITHSSASSGQVHKITFVDTPGHEAFSKMRTRGAKLADLGILVVAADESVKPQTKEAIEILNQTETPFVVAINKIDKNNADIEKIKNDLMRAGVLLEGCGGNISWQAISAKTGQGINELLDLILLSAEMEQLTYNSEAKASGVIIESKMDNSRGLSIAGIVENGVLKLGDEIATASAAGKIRILENFLGEKVSELYPSSPALIIGFESPPQIGEEFWCGKINVGDVGHPSDVQRPNIEAVISAKTTLNFIIKADVSGSLEAICEIIKTIADVKIVDASVGDITDGDVRNALNNKAAILGFRVEIKKAAENLARGQEIKIITSEIIYELVKKVEEEIENVKEPKANPELEILAVFGKKSGPRQVVGGKVVSGEFKNNSKVQIKRQERVIGEARIINLQCEKQDVKVVNENMECGMLVEADVAINVGDRLIA